MNAAAKKNHALTHTKAVVWLYQNQPSFNWLVDFNIHVTFDDEGYILRPDIVGENKKNGQYQVFVEISDSTLSKDMGKKADIYAAQGIESYIVVDCKAKKVIQHQLSGKGYIEQEVFAGMDGLFEV